MQKFLCIAASILAAGVAFGQNSTLQLTPIQTWQCESQAKQARAFAHEMVAFKGKDCSAFLENSREILRPLEEAASFGNSNIFRQCYTGAFRDEIGKISARVIETCSQDIESSLNAGIKLGNFVCRSAVHSNTPELSYGTLVGSKFDPNTKEPTLKIVVPIRSTLWAEQLASTQIAGFDLGCLQGDMENILATPFPYASGNEINWTSAAFDIGQIFGKAYCPIEAERAIKIVENMLMGSLPGSAGTTKEIASDAFKKGFETACNISL